MIGGEVCKSTVITNIAFSGCSKYLLVQNGSPDWVLTVWKWYNAKVRSYITTGTGPIIKNSENKKL